MSDKNELKEAVKDILEQIQANIHARVGDLDDGDPIDLLSGTHLELFTFNDKQLGLNVSGKGVSLSVRNHIPGKKTWGTVKHPAVPISHVKSLLKGGPLVVSQNKPYTVENSAGIYRISQIPCPAVITVTHKGTGRAVVKSVTHPFDWMGLIDSKNTTHYRSALMEAHVSKEEGLSLRASSRRWREAVEIKIEYTLTKEDADHLATKIQSQLEKEGVLLTSKDYEHLKTGSQNEWRRVYKYTHIDSGYQHVRTTAADSATTATDLRTRMANEFNQWKKDGTSSRTASLKRLLSHYGPFKGEDFAIEELGEMWKHEALQVMRETRQGYSTNAR